jgi:hypothetical protein
MNRLVIVARLREGARAEAEALLAGGPPFDPEVTGLARHGAYLTEDSVVFVFEDHDVEWEIDDMLGDLLHPEVAKAVDSWRSLLDGPPKLSREAYFWAREGSAR